eukprot:TRINITY_DN11678_c0_g2_i1.p1 TRINITY_DN11678_c0_g2~~TRINITY_DN11678_c0_g2_i1.p1  ORF type:complete len:442 (+),score=106.52 TRINITY_DN11678_c0_g2_i1:84-1409(+)
MVNNELVKSRTSRLVVGTTEKKPSNIDGEGVWAMLNHPLNTMIVFFPLGIASHYLFHWGDVVTFWLNFFSLVPLAKILGDSTEELAAGLKNDMLAGLLNATFGNAVEVVIMMQTLRAGYYDVVKASLLGSMLSNLLLVLGMSFFFGGLLSFAKKKPMQTFRPTMKRKSMTAAASKSGANTPNKRQEERIEYQLEFASEKLQSFSNASALVNTSMLLLSCLSFSLVTIFHAETHGGEHSVMLPVSRICSIICSISYAAYVYFQLVTHKDTMEEEGEGDDEEDEPPKFNIQTALACMCTVTLLIAFSSEMLVASFEGVVEQLGINSNFIGIILLPIVGNACEHVSAIRFAMMDKCGLAIGIAVGSSTQIALFAVPFSVVFAWIIDKPLDLNFGLLNTTVLTISVVVVLSIVVDGKANWLQGYLLVSAYFVIAVLYWHLPHESV